MLDIRLILHHILVAMTSSTFYSKNKMFDIISYNYLT